MPGIQHFDKNGYAECSLQSQTKHTAVLGSDPGIVVNATG